MNTEKVHLFELLYAQVDYFQKYLSRIEQYTKLI